ncbi:MAG: cysteine--tRNA ligase [Actinomycetota bacterium]|nr:cysteine--tRNA ligase [Actinomycetota bacterium]
MLRLYDTIHGEVRDLATRDAGRLSMYVCGPTVDNLPHLGHGRFTLVWDVARRWFTFRGLDVHFVSNITDIDDKIIARAQREGTTESVVATTYEDQWWAAMAAIGVARPDDVPHATQYVPEMVMLIESFLAEDIAYVISDGVYFDTSRVSDYGLLAGQALDSLRAGARIEANEEKRSPLDFTLWKFAKPGEPRWEAPFGEGRPGWHTECVVMSLGLLGDGFDLHCGGLDLKFPHHENERAQAVAAQRPFAQHWGHNGWVMVGDEKMSKSLGNFTSLTDLLEGTDARAYRLLVIRSHYRSPIEVSPTTIADAERALARLDTLARRFDLPALAGQEMLTQSDFDFTGPSALLAQRVGALLDEDLNTPLAVAELFDAVSRANTLADQGEVEEARDIAMAVTVLFAALGLSVFSAVHDSDDEVRELARARDEARRAGEWGEADRLRDEISARGWVVEDSAEGTRIRRG